MNNKFNKPTILVVLIFLFAVVSNLNAKDFPATVIDGTERSVTLKKMPERVISLGAASTEILFEVGAEAQIAAVSNVSNYPEAAKNLPSAGGFSADSISLETLISYKPDLILIYKGMHSSFIPSFEKYKIAYYVIDAQTVADVITDIKNIAVLTGHKKTGDELAAKYNDILANVKKSSDSASPKVYWEVWYEPFMSAGKQSFINDVISLAGGTNIFGDIDQAYPIVSEETIISSNPQFVLIPGDVGLSKADVLARSPWQSIDAFKNDKVIIFDADVYTRSGPRIFTAIQELNAILYE